MKKLRRNARMLCIQHLYAYLQQQDEALDDVITRSMALNEETEFDEEFFRTLIHKTVSELEHLDERIKKRSRNWDFSRITLMDKIILRQSIAEMMYIEDVPPRVTISEAIELAKEFSTDESHVFVNGMLDRIYKDLVEEGILMPEIKPAKEG
ncbi:MAG: transcription antitermination factor NusB [bacterium]|jgi:N utilization substance protein B|nr:transcription antitermination factor NusB [Candidatus Neomarinimicrobiota bacterium]MDX9780829.1 transcription antitermination factor NusB [bacterium]